METVMRLNEVATSKLSEIVRKSAGGEAGWQGYDEAEVIVAKELLSRDATTITR
jgi:ER membrane protein complex subunit 2